MRRSGCHWAPSLCLFGAMLAIYPPSGRAQDATRKVVKKVDAQYPAALKHRGIGGTVRLKVYVKADGTVRDTEVLGGSAALAESAQKAVMQWRFTQGSAETTMEVSVVFNPDA
jgi:TonB family protein